MKRSPAAIAGLKQCLALEHEAVWVYAYLGARVREAEAEARQAFDSRRRTRDALIAMLAASRATQPAPLPSYAVADVGNLEQARSVARSLEAKGAVAYLSLVGASEGTDRAFAITMLRKAALATLDWGGKPTAYPGLPA